MLSEVSLIDLLSLIEFIVHIYGENSMSNRARNESDIYSKLTQIGKLYITLYPRFK